MRLDDLSPAKGSKKNRKRVGRGIGSGTGKTAGKGSKGHKSRTGEGKRPGFEGGQMPMQRRLPKRGFTNVFRKKIDAVNIRDLSKFENGAVVDEIALVSAGLIKGKRDGVKLLGEGEITYPLTIRLNSISKGAREKIKAAGGTIDESLYRE